MRLLFDENLSARLIELLCDVYPESEQVLEAGLGGADDDAVWDYARLRGLTIVSKDSDFADLSVLRGAPPKVIRIRLGNCTTMSIALLLRNSSEAVRAFLMAKQEMCLELGRKRAAEPTHSR